MIDEPESITCHACHRCRTEYVVSWWLTGFWAGLCAACADGSDDAA